VNWISVLQLLNILLTSGIVILSFALAIYLLLYNFRNRVAQIFSALLCCILIVYFVELVIVAAPVEVALEWLRFQWVGIAFTPAAYLHFTSALLETTNDRSRRRAWGIGVAYILGGMILLGALLTDRIVWDGILQIGTIHLRAGPQFWFFVLYFAIFILWGLANVLRAWERCLTSTSRRRMAYLALASLAPPVSVFPYLVLTGWPQRLPAILLWLLLVLGNLCVGSMLMVMAYTVAFFGVLTPDRVVKHRFVRYLLRGPFQATVVVAIIIAASQSGGLLGLSPLQLALFGVVIAILLVQLGVEWSKPLIDRLLYRRDEQEIAWIQSLSNRLLTTTDLRQFLENILTALCDLLRTPSAFVAVVEGEQARIEVVCGAAGPDLSLPAGGIGALAGRLQPSGDLYVWDGYWLLPLRSRSDDELIGILGLRARSPEIDLSAEEQDFLHSLAHQIEAALEDRMVQQALFSVLERIIPQIEEIQRRREMLRYEGAPALARLADPLATPEFPRWVWDALDHYWGGPKLTRSPLLNLQVVERASDDHGGPVNALRAVLLRAIERLRPEGERSLTATEWLLYNILELKFIKGYRVRDVAMRLAMSESDFYRKQRIAIQELARVLAEMEREERARGNSPPSGRRSV
jgi:GAF domain-containing protein